MKENIICTNCPRKCLKFFYCGKDKGVARVAKVMRHKFEEPIICPKDKGSGAVFFSNCPLKCVFCQNYEISLLGRGRDVTTLELAKIFKKVEKSGASNLNLVTPTHYLDIIIDSLKLARVKIPVVWNTSGYESTKNIQKLKGLVDIFLFDCKYYDDNLALKYSKVSDYFDRCIESIKMARKIIPKDIIKNGQMKKGIIIRHLILPTHTDDSIKIFENIKKECGTNMYISLMSQYIPIYKAKDFPEINRRITPLEYKRVVMKVKSLGFKKGFMQDFDSSDSKYIPDFSDSKFWEL